LRMLQMLSVLHLLLFLESDLLLLH
jgi:hypothetical protein